MNNSILKGFAILRMFSRERPEVSAAVLVEELGTNTATAHRLLATLEEAGAIESVRRGVFRLGPVLADLGRMAEDTNPLARRLQAVLETLAGELGESVMACRLSRRGPTSIAVAIPDRPFAMGFGVGTTVSLSTSAQGRLYLARMSEQQRAEALKAAGHAPSEAPPPHLLRVIAERGVAISLGEAESEVGAVAVPVPKDGTVRLTLSSFGPVSRIDDAFVARAVPRLQKAAFDIAATYLHQARLPPTDVAPLGGDPFDRIKAGWRLD